MPDERLVVIRDFDFIGINPLPAETNPILIIDADTMLTASISLKAFQSVSWWNCELAQLPNPIELCQLATDDRPKLGWTSSPRSSAIDTIEQVFGSRVRKGAYHGMYYNDYRRYAP
jgi:hypothetical protein